MLSISIWISPEKQYSWDCNYLCSSRRWDYPRPFGKYNPWNLGSWRLSESTLPRDPTETAAAATGMGDASFGEDSFLLRELRKRVRFAWICLRIPVHVSPTIYKIQIILSKNFIKLFYGKVSRYRWLGQIW